MKQITSNLIIINVIKEIVKCNPSITLTELVEIFTNNASDKAQRYEIKKKVTTIVAEHFKNLK